MSTFPLNHNTQGWDSSLYEVTSEDPAIKTEMEGGYMVSRPRHTRLPRRTFSLGWRSMSAIDAGVLKSFYDAMRGASLSFNWTDPNTNTTVTVRFKDGLTLKYVGKGSLKLYDCNLKFEEV